MSELRHKPKVLPSFHLQVQIGQVFRLRVKLNNDEAAPSAPSAKKRRSATVEGEDPQDRKRRLSREWHQRKREAKKAAAQAKE